MAERHFFSGFVLPVAAAIAVLATSGSRLQGGRAGSPWGGPDENSGGSPADRGRGRSATKPHQIPARGWRDILWRVKDEISKDHVSVLAAGIGFYSLLAIFPALGAAISIYGLVADPQQIEQRLAEAAGLLPEQAAQIITGQLSAIASQPRGSLGFGLILGILLALWSASAAISTIMTGLNVAYDETEKRGVLAFYATALGLTLGAIVSGIIALSLIAALPAAFNVIGLSEEVELALSLSRWPLLVVGTMIGLAVLYRYGPSRKEAKWRWVSWGAAAATLIWVIGSALFSIYVSNFANYNETYGTLGAVVILLMWFYLTGYAILLGAELNAEMEHQTARDTTEHEGAPLGTRGAYVADTVGAVP